MAVWDKVKNYCPLQTDSLQCFMDSLTTPLTGRKIQKATACCWTQEITSSCFRFSESYCKNHVDTASSWGFFLSKPERWGRTINVWGGLKSTTRPRGTVMSRSVQGDRGCPMVKPCSEEQQGWERSSTESGTCCTKASLVLSVLVFSICLITSHVVASFSPAIQHWHAV